MKNYSKEEIIELVKTKKIGVKELIDNGICPTCFNKENNNILYGSTKNTLIYENSDLEILLVTNPRSIGHTVIISKNHYKDMLEIPDDLCQEMFLIAKKTMNILKEVYKCESVYLCTMCDGPINHFHIQLIPRYQDKLRGSKNFVKERKNYIFDKEKFTKLKELLKNKKYKK